MCRYNTELQILVAVSHYIYTSFWYTYLLYLQMKYWGHVLWNFYIININSHFIFMDLFQCVFQTQVDIPKVLFYPPHPPIELIIARFDSALKVCSKCLPS